MKIEYSHHLAELTFDALLKSFNRRKTFIRFLRSMHISDNALAGFAQEDTKREFLERIFPKLQNSEEGKRVIIKMSLALYEQKEFPDLKGPWEDSDLKIKQASEAVPALQQHLLQQNTKIIDKEEKLKFQEEARQKAEEIKLNRASLTNLENRLGELTTHMGTQRAGYDFQDWFYDLADFFEVQCTRPYMAHGRQIDGSLSINGTDYLVELKFQKPQAAVGDVDNLHGKLRSKADNTLGLIIAMSGFSSVAVEQAKTGRTQIILLDYSHVYLLLRGSVTLSELIDRVKRHAAQTGDAYLAVSSMGL